METEGRGAFRGGERREGKGMGGKFRGRVGKGSTKIANNGGGERRGGKARHSRTQEFRFLTPLGHPHLWDIGLQLGDGFEQVGVKMTVFGSDDKVAAAWKEGRGCMHDEPWVLQSSDHLNNLLSDSPDRKAPGTFKRWVAEFPLNKFCQDTATVVSPFLEQFGCKEFGPLFDELTPPTAALKPETPTLQQLMCTDYLYGMSQQFAKMEFDRCYLGSLMINVAGTCTIIAMDGSSALRFAKEHRFDNRAMNPASLSDCLRGFTLKDAKEMADKGVNIFFGTMGPKTCAHFPSGWIVGITPDNAEPVAGVKRSIVMKRGVEAWKNSGESAKQNMQTPAVIKDSDAVLDRIALGTA